jgi:hypothetical protein
MPLGRHQRLQNLVARASLGKKSLGKMQDSRKRFPRDRVDLLPHGCLVLSKGKSFRCSATRRRPLHQRLRYATQAEVACDRFLLAYLSRFQAGDLLTERMKNLAGPAGMPRLDHPAALPMERITQEKAGRIPQIGALVRDDQPFAAILFSPYHLGKRPIRALLAIPPRHGAWAEALRMVGA